MPRYERAGEFWEIEQDGPRLVITAGAIGRAGKQTVRKFISAEYAQVQLRNATEQKHADGYVAIAGTDVTANDFSERTEELERAIVDNPYNPQAYSVYGDWLQARGVPRGALIASHVAYDAAEHASRREAATRAFLADHGSELVATLDRHHVKGLAAKAVVWRFGFIHRVAVLNDRKLFKTQAVLEDILRDPSTRFLAELALQDRTRPLAAALAVLAQTRPATLRVLQLTTEETLDDKDCLPTLAGLRSLSISLHRPVVTASFLKSLARIPASVEKLDLRFGSLVGLELHELLARTDLAAFKHLRLRRVGLADTIVRAIVEGPLAANLVTLDLGLSPLDDASLEHLLAHRDRFPNLAELAISSDSPRVAELRAVITRVVDVQPTDATVDDRRDTTGARA